MDSTRCICSGWSDVFLKRVERTRNARGPSASRGSHSSSIGSWNCRVPARRFVQVRVAWSDGVEVQRRECVFVLHIPDSLHTKDARMSRVGAQESEARPGVYANLSNERPILSYQARFPFFVRHHGPKCKRGFRDDSRPVAFHGEPPYLCVCETGENSQELLPWSSRPVTGWSRLTQAA